MADLLISPDLHLSIDAVTKTIGILAARRSGKTYTAAVMAEEFVRLGVPWVALDPTGAWHGLRSGADGKAEGGLPVVVLGGQHGDVPLERGSGALVADLVVDHPGWYVLDLSMFESKSAERQFAHQFADRLYRRKAKATFPMHLFVDEADVFMPQRPDKGDLLMLGAFEAIVRRGGIRGLGTTIISQRAAVVNKNVLEQIQMLLALRTSGRIDRKAILDYVKAEGTPEQVAELTASLASLALGEAWVWEPAEDVFARVQIRERRTFNSSATPKAGEEIIEAKGRVAIDLDAVRTSMAATIEKAKADDPTVLKREVARLTKELAQRPVVQAPEPVRVEVPVLSAESIATLARTAERVEALYKRAEKLGTEVGDLLFAVNQVKVEATVAVKTPAPRPRPTPVRVTPPDPVGLAAEPAVKLVEDATSADDLAITGLHKTILSVCAQYPEGIVLQKLGLLTKKSPAGGYFKRVLGELRSAGLVERGQPIRITAAGLAAIEGQWEPIPTGPEALAFWADDFFSGLGGKVLRLVADGGTYDQEAAQEAVEADPSGGYFKRVLGQLRTAGLISKGWPLRATPDFLDAIA